MNNQTDSKPHQPDVFCPYCGNAAELVTGKEIYPALPKLRHSLFYSCLPCKAYVGTHGDGRPLGTLANAELRHQRRNTHHVFDRLWQAGLMSRSQCYRWMADTLGITAEQAHIAMLNPEQCMALREAASKMLNHLLATRTNKPKPPRDTRRR